MAEKEKELTNKELEYIAGGYPDGDFPNGVNICPRCGSRELKLEHEGTVDTFGSSVIDSQVPGKNFQVFACTECGCRFYRYGPFYEFIR